MRQAVVLFTDFIFTIRMPFSILSPRMDSFSLGYLASFELPSPRTWYSPLPQE